MILVDTSVWIDHFRSPEERLRALLFENQVLVHPFVIGELACGNLQSRHQTLGLLKSLPRAKVASDEEAYHLIEMRGLIGLGLGFIDVHLLGACQLTACKFWTRDKALRSVASKLGLV